jgi:uncharacterized delta-60 repeat protein
MHLQRLYRPIALVACLVLGAGTAAWAASGDIDPGFGGGDGIAELPVEGSNFKALVVDPQGRTIVATAEQGDSHRKIHVVRFQRDGTPSPDFGTNGVTRVTFGPDEQTLVALFLRSDGKIVLSAHHNSPNDIPPSGSALARLTPNGQLDPSFGDQGILRFPRDPSSPQFLAMDGANRVYAIDRIGSNTYELIRLDPDGQLDTTYAGGHLSVPEPHGARPLSVRAGGQVLYKFWDGVECNCPQFLAFRADGRANRQFGDRGSITTDPPSGAGVVDAGVWTNTGRVLVWTTKGFLGRYLANGELDPDFGVGGWNRWPQVGDRPKGDSRARIEFATSSDGIYVIGLKLARLRNDGRLNRSFGTNGFVSVLPGMNSFRTIAFGSPGEITLGAWFDARRPVLIRLLT